MGDYLSGGRKDYLVKLELFTELLIGISGVWLSLTSSCHQCEVFLACSISVRGDPRFAFHFETRAPIRDRGETASGKILGDTPALCGEVRRS